MPASNGDRRKTSPKPGRPVRGSHSGRPIMALLDLLGRRWVLRILWELRAGPLTFRALREAADDVSPSVLNRRLADLREAAIVAATDDGYALTPLGRDLIKALAPTFRWADRWQRTLASDK